jgi:hypothetical protein
MVAFTSGSALVDRGVAAAGSAAVLTFNTTRTELSNFLKILAGKDPLKPPAPEEKKSVELNKKLIETFYDETGKKVDAYKFTGNLNEFMALGVIVDGAKGELKQYGGKLPEGMKLQLIIQGLDGKDIAINLVDVPSSVTPENLAEFLSKSHGQGRAAIDAITSQRVEMALSQNGKGGIPSFIHCLSVKVVVSDIK